MEINLSVPCGWQHLNYKQLLFVFTLLAHGASESELKLKCLLKFSGTHVLGECEDGVYRLKHGKRKFNVTPLQMAEALSCLDFLTELPATPVRLPFVKARLRKRYALAADFNGVPFEKFIICDNLYNGYLHTKNSELLAQMTEVLYCSRIRHVAEPVRISVFYWFAALKQLLTRNFSNLFGEQQEDGNMLGNASLAKQLADAMNAQIRALTKGDVTKEKEVLALDTWRALTELDAQVKEYNELKLKYK